VLGILNFLRDRACVEVSLQWDMETFGETEYDANKRWGIVGITNVGRRPVHVSHVALKLPKGAHPTHLLIMEGLKGETLAEGSERAVHIVTQDGLEKYAAHWGKIIAQVSDSTGRVWESKPVKEMPSWAKPEND
jgi:hypothetical protein